MKHLIIILTLISFSCQNANNDEGEIEQNLDGKEIFSLTDFLNFQEKNFKYDFYSKALVSLDGDTTISSGTADLILSPNISDTSIDLTIKSLKVESVDYRNGSPADTQQQHIEMVLHYDNFIKNNKLNIKQSNDYYYLLLFPIIDSELTLNNSQTKTIQIPVNLNGSVFEGFVTQTTELENIIKEGNDTVYILNVSLALDKVNYPDNIKHSVELDGVSKVFYNKSDKIYNSGNLKTRIAVTLRAPNRADFTTIMESETEYSKK